MGIVQMQHAARAAKQGDLFADQLVVEVGEVIELIDQAATKLVNIELPRELEFALDPEFVEVLHERMCCLALDIHEIARTAKRIGII